MLVDYERAWLELKREVVSKNSHGKRDLLARMAEIEVESEIDEAGYDPRPYIPPNGHQPTVAGSRET